MVLATVAVLTGCNDEANEPYAAQTTTTEATMPATTTSTTIDPAVLADLHELAVLADLARFGRWVNELNERAETVRTRPRAGSAPASATDGLGPCGGDLPPCSVKARESGGDYSAVNPTGCSGRTCGGAWQFDPNTWNNYGGYARAQDAPPDVQDAKARELWANGSGCSHWAAC